MGLDMGGHDDIPMKNRPLMLLAVDKALNHNRKICFALKNRNPIHDGTCRVVK